MTFMPEQRYKTERSIKKEKMTNQLVRSSETSFEKYRAFFIGSSSLAEFIKYEFVTFFTSHLPGALGLALRKWLYPKIVGRIGRGVLWGRNIVIRHGVNMVFGNNVAIDDNCQLDAKGSHNQDFRIGNDVVIARDTIVQAKTAWLHIGNRCVIGSQCQLSSAGGITIGNDVMLGGQCYIGGGRYRTDDKSKPMMDQGLYTKGPVVIGDDVWIGAGAIVLDGVQIGKGSFIGAGAIIAEDVDEYTIVAPYQKQIKIPRSGSSSPKDSVPDRTDKIIEEDQTGADLNDQNEIIEKQIYEIVYQAIDEINRQTPPERRLEREPQTVLFINGNTKSLESLGLLNLIVTTEQKIEENFGIEVNLAEEDVLKKAEHPFRTVSTLVDYLLGCLSKVSHS